MTIMEDLDDIKYAVYDTCENEIVAFFNFKHHASAFLSVYNGESRVIVRDEDFYIDLHTDVTSNIDVRI